VLAGLRAWHGILVSSGTTLGSCAGGPGSGAHCLATGQATHLRLEPVCCMPGLALWLALAVPAWHCACRYAQVHTLMTLQRRVPRHARLLL